jgi:hypothetical protein
LWCPGDDASGRTQTRSRVAVHSSRRCRNEKGRRPSSPIISSSYPDWCAHARWREVTARRDPLAGALKILEKGSRTPGAGSGPLKPFGPQWRWSSETTHAAGRRSGRPATKEPT